MRKFIAYILLCINILFGIGISSKYIFNNIKKDHDYSYSKQITIKFDLKNKNENEIEKEINENIEYIKKQLEKNNELNYRISFNKDGIINIFIIQNAKNFEQINDFLTRKKIELCIKNKDKEECVLMNSEWKTNIEQDEVEKKIIISIPKNEIDNVHKIYLKKIEEESGRIEEILKSNLESKTEIKKNFFIRIKFENNKNKNLNREKKIYLKHQVFYQKKNEIDKFQIIFPNKNKISEEKYKELYEQYEQEEDINYYEKILNSNNEKNNYEIIDNTNINEPLNTDLTKKYLKLNKTFFILIATFIIIFLTLIFMYRFNSIAIIVTIILQLFLTFFSLIITKQFFNTKVLFGLITIILISLLIHSIQNNHFYKKLEDGVNSKNACLESYQKTKPIIFGTSIIYLISGLIIYFTGKNVNNLGLVNTFFVNTIINLFVHIFIFNKLTWLINNSVLLKKRYEIFSQFKQQKEEKNLVENNNFYLKKEKKIFFVFIITFIISLFLMFNLKSFFGIDTFKHKKITNNIRIILENNEKTIPYLLNYLNEIKINDQTINFNKKNIKKLSYFNKNNKYDEYVINLNINEKDLSKENYVFEDKKNSLEKILKNIEEKIGGSTIKLEKEYFYDSEFSITYLVITPILTVSLFCFYLLVMKYKLSQIMCVFFISTIVSLIPIIFISFSHIFVESSLILFSTFICTYFSLITCLHIINENKFDNFNEMNNENNTLSKILKNNWEFIGKNLIITNCFFLMLSFLEGFTVILLASLIGLVFLIFMIKYFFILFSNQFDMFSNLLEKIMLKPMKNFKKLSKNKDNIIENKEEIFKGINEY